MHEIKKKLMDELYEVENEIKKSGTKISGGMLEHLHKLTDTIKNIDKICDHEEGYSEATDFMGEGRMYGTSYRRRRDSMGRYSRDGGSSYEDGYTHKDGTVYGDDMMSERRGYSRRGNYSYADAKTDMAHKFEELLSMAETPEEKKAIERCKRQVDNM